MQNSQLEVAHYSRNRLTQSIYKFILMLMPSIKSFVRESAGFTLIELLIVISIIGILASLTLASFGGAQAKAKDGVRKSDLSQIKRALELAKADCQGASYYPVVAGADEYARFDALQAHLDAVNLNYMSVVPDDPKNSGTSMYGYHTDAAPVANVCPTDAVVPAQTQSGSTNFMLRGLLERGSADADSQKSFLACTGKPGMPGAAGGYYYVCNN